MTLLIYTFSSSTLNAGLAYLVILTATKVKHCSSAQYDIYDRYRNIFVLLLSHSS